MTEVSVNGRRYRAPERPAVVICFDGCDPAYIERGIADGTPLALTDSRQAALGHAMGDELEIASLH